jgi:hypothetical protein
MRTGQAGPVGLVGKNALSRVSDGLPTRRPRPARRAIACGCAIVALLVAALHAQPMMDPKQMSGIPRTVSELPAGTVSVRVVRGQLSNYVANQVVELVAGGETRTARTDESGRAEFAGLAAGARVKTSAVVGSERLESQEFPVPAEGGVRLLLVATELPESAPSAPAAAARGEVVLAGDSRIVIEPGEDAARVYYLLGIVNRTREPVSPSAEFTFDLPEDASGATILEGSSPNAGVSGRRVRVQGPFAPGQTLVQVGCELPYSEGSLRLTQRFPAVFEDFGIAVKKVGALKVSSPQVARQQDMNVGGDTYVIGGGGSVPAGQPVTIAIDGLPYASATPRRIAVSLALAIMAWGAWAFFRGSDRPGLAEDRRRLFERRERLFTDLVRLESERADRSRPSDAGRQSPALRSELADPPGDSLYASRREELVAALEHVYGGLAVSETESQAAGDASSSRR